VLTAALALVALPGLAGSRAPSPIEPVPAGAFQQLTIPADDSRSTVSIGSLDDAFLSAGALGADSPIVEPDAARTDAATGRTTADQPKSTASTVRKGARSATVHGSPRYTLTGGATFYDNGTTAMRLPRGTVVKICGQGGCIVRVVNDYGPQKKSRVVDLYRPDFFAICGCASWAGTTQVTVYVY
jgi:3D (Asp-Asp-Asp) domain-containing protein